MNRFAWLTVLLVVVAATGPTLVKLLNAVVPVIALCGITAVVVRVVWTATHRW